MNTNATALAVKRKHPELVDGEDWYFRDDGAGPYLAKWPDGLELPTDEEVERAEFLIEQQTYTATLESHYDAVAQQRRYDNRLTCALRAGHEGPFQAEGIAFAIWMDSQNVYAYAQFDAVLAGEREKPTPDELIAELSLMVWPQ